MAGKGTPFFKKGYDPRRNLKGRSRSPFEVIRKRVKTFLEDKSAVLDSEGKKRTIRRIEILVAKLYKKALAGDSRSIQILFEYGYGKVPNKNEITGPDGGPVVGAVGISQDALDAIEGRILGEDEQ